MVKLLFKEVLTNAFSTDGAGECFFPTPWSVGHMARFFCLLAELSGGTASTESNIIDGETQDDFNIKLERTT